MTYDLLRYARESAIALREAQAEIERKGRQLEKSEREYLGIRTERDTAIADNARLRAELSTQETLVATLREQKYAWDELLGENKFLRAELETANSLVKRHEDALIFLFKEPFARFMNIQNYETFSLSMNEKWAWVSFDDNDDEFYLRHTPLDAIEAAMKEKS